MTRAELAPVTPSLGGSLEVIDIPDEDFDLKAGPEAMRRLPLSCLIVLPQIRREYNPDDIDSLATALDASDRNLSGEFAVKLLYGPTVDALDEAQFRRFLRDHSNYYRIKLSEPSEYPLGPGGLYYVVISGNTRTVTLNRMCKDHGIEPERAGIMCSIEYNTSFHDTNGDQARENIRQDPPDHDRAYAIYNEFLYRQQMMRRLGQGPAYLSHASIAKHFGYSPDIVGAALRYVELPKSLRNLVEDVDQEQPLATYGVALALHPYMMAYAKRYKLDLDSKAVDIAIMALVNQYMNDKLSSGTNLENFKRIIRGKINALEQPVALTDDTLFLLADPDTPTNMQKKYIKSNRKLAIAALGALRHVANSGQFDSEVGRQIDGLLASLGSVSVNAGLDEDNGDKTIELPSETEPLF